MADPYREPVDAISAPPATSYTPPTPPVAPITSADIAAPAPAMKIPEATTPVPDGFIPPTPAVVVPDVATHPEAISVMPAASDTPVDTPVVSVAPQQEPPNAIRTPTATEKIDLLAHEVPTNITPDTPPTSPVPHLSGEIPLQDIPPTVPVAQPVEAPAKHGVFEAGVIMPPSLDAVAQPTPAPATEPHEFVPSKSEEPAPVAPEPIAPPPAAPIATPEPIVKKSAIRTLQSDIAQTVQQNQLSIADIALAQKGKDQTIVVDTGETKDTKSFLMGVVSTLLILGGLGAIGFVLYTMRASLGVPFLNNDNHIVTIIPASNVATVNVSTTTQTALLAHIETFMDDRSAQVLDVRALVLLERVSATSTDTHVVPFERFMTLIGSRAPGRLVRTLGPDMMLGAVGNEPFLLVPHSSYDNAFAGMLEWEALMRDDLPFLTYATPAVVVTEPPLTPVASSTTATSSHAIASSSPPVEVGPAPAPVVPPGNDELNATNGSTSPELPTPVVLNASWKDIVIKNVDARALVRDDGEILMLYSFLRDNLLLITTRKETMSVILDILSTPHFGE